MTWAQKHRLVAVSIFIVMMHSLPAGVIFYRWLMFFMTTIFWLLVSAGIAAYLLSLWAEWREDD